MHVARLLVAACLASTVGCAHAIVLPLTPALSPPDFARATSGKQAGRGGDWPSRPRSRRLKRCSCSPASAMAAAGSRHSDRWRRPLPPTASTSICPPTFLAPVWTTAGAPAAVHSRPAAGPVRARARLRLHRRRLDLQPAGRARRSAEPGDHRLRPQSVPGACAANRARESPLPDLGAVRRRRLRRRQNAVCAAARRPACKSGSSWKRRRRRSSGDTRRPRDGYGPYQFECDASGSATTTACTSR